MRVGPSDGAQSPSTSRSTSYWGDGGTFQAEAPARLSAAAAARVSEDRAEQQYDHDDRRRDRDDVKEEAERLRL